MTFSRKMKVGIVATVSSLAIAGAAFAYFTNTGSGTGAGTVGTSTPLTIAGVVTNALYPGTDSPVTFTATNGSTGHQYVGTIHLASITSSPAGCTNGTLGDFVMADVVVNQDLPAGGPTTLAPAVGGVLSMTNTAVSQDACKNAVLTLNLTST